MGIDYNAYHGIGYEVEPSDELDESDLLDDGFAEYLECEISEGFDAFETGNCFSGQMTGCYVTINNPFKNGLDLTGAKKDLDNELARLKIEAVSEFSSVGGLIIW